MDEERLRRFEQEARAAGALNHPSGPEWRHDLIRAETCSGRQTHAWDYGTITTTPCLTPDCYDVSHYT